MVRIIKNIRSLRIARIKKKYVDFDLYKKALNLVPKIKTKSRTSTVLPLFRNQTINVYNGKRYVPFEVTADHIGHKFGEFVYTRRLPDHKKKGKKVVIKKKENPNRKEFKNICNFYLSGNENIYACKNLYNLDNKI